MPENAATVLADQAIFTSAPGATGEGYRIIAATPGVRADERMEITRRSPSHDSLCNDESEAMGLLAYPLTSGRFCVAISRPIGQEHTARGGDRVYTYMAILDHAAFSRFEFNPIRVCTAIDMAVVWRPLEIKSEALDPLPLAAGSGETLAIPANRITPDRIAWTLKLARDILHGERLVAAAADAPFDMLHMLITALPMALRRYLSVSCGLRYAPSRGVILSLVSHDPAAAERAVRGQRIRCCDLRVAPEYGPTPYEKWLTLLRRWFGTRRTGDIAKLTSDLKEDISPEALNRVTHFCDAIDAVPGADRKTLRVIEQRHSASPPQSAVELDLDRRLCDLIVKRSAELDRAEAKVKERS